MKQDSSQNSQDIDLNLAKKFTSRNVRDLITKLIVYAGGGSVLIALGLIFVYLGIEVIPLFQGADLESTSSQINSPTVINHLSVEEQNQIAMSIDNAGVIQFINIETGKVVLEEKLTDKKITSSQTLKESSTIHVLVALEDGTAFLIKPEYKSVYSESSSAKTEKTVVPSLTYPLGNESIILHEDGSAISNLSFQINDETITVVSTSTDNFYVTTFVKEESFLDDEVSWEKEQEIISNTLPANHVFIDQEQRNILAINDAGEFINYSPDLDVKQTGNLLLDKNSKVTAAATLSAGSSLLVANDKGIISQWFPVRNENNVFKYIRIREFNFETPVVKIVPEYSRKVAYVYDSKGTASIIHATSGQIINTTSLANGLIDNLAISPRSNAILVKSGNNISLYKAHNEHPEFSMAAIWSKVWYEGYEKPEYIWQSSSSSNDFEPKFSFMPLAFGTLKAAFYAMLFATPIGVLAGAYTAYFMRPRLRKVVKPTVEIMAALPTVILGFLAGLWLAPFIENNLPGIFSVPIILLIGIVVLSFIWTILPKDIRNNIPEGYEIVFLIPAIIFLIWLSFYLSPTFEIMFFGGNTRLWLKETLGVGFDQRNSIIIGITMGIAVIPNIFSITEDAVYGVPRSLTNGSLALGATQWQTMTRVIVLTASPAIFSAIMIGMGRAIGETMIVLMATGNTPIMDFNIFEGMRTLAANIAVEMAEAEVDSTHFRLLFLSAFALFILTFVFNTLSEIISTRLRKKYSNL